MKGKIDYSIFIGGSLVIALLYFTTGIEILKVLLAAWFFFSQVAVLTYRYMNTGKIYLRASYVEGKAARMWIILYGVLGIVITWLVGF